MWPSGPVITLRTFGNRSPQLRVAEVLVERLQHALLDEQRDRERVDVRAVRRRAGPGLLEQARLLGGGHVVADDVEVQAPLRVLLDPVEEQLAEALGDRRRRR